MPGGPDVVDSNFSSEVASLVMCELETLYDLCRLHNQDLRFAMSLASNAMKSKANAGLLCFLRGRRRVTLANVGAGANSHLPF